MAFHANGKKYFTHNDVYDFDVNDYIIPPDVDLYHSEYIPAFLNRDSYARTNIHLKNTGFDDLKIVLHEAQLNLDKSITDDENGIDKYLIKWNDPENFLGAHFFATDNGVYQFGDIDEIMYHAAAIKDGLPGNSYSVGIERTVDKNTIFPLAIYNQAKCAASVIKYYSLLYGLDYEDEIAFAKNNVITHTEASTGLTLEQIRSGLIANIKLNYYYFMLSDKEIEKYENDLIIPSSINDLSKRMVKICPARTIAGWYGGMQRIKEQIIENLQRYKQGDYTALFNEIVYNKEYLEKDDKLKKRLRS